MILAIDIGNTTIAINIVKQSDFANRGSGLEKNMEILFTGKLPSKGQTPGAIPENLAEEANTLTLGYGQCDFDHVMISSVVPELNDAVASWAKDFTGLEPVFVKWDTVPEKVLRFAIPNPEKLGPDRICDAIGAAGEYPLPVITVDLGSATTFNVVDRHRTFLGGIIAPGIRMGMRALSAGASLLSETEMNIPDHYIGKNTAECMLLGTAVCTAAMIDGMAERIEEELGEKATLVLTGGNAVYAEPYLRHEHRMDRDLLLKGMCALARWKEQD